MLEKDTQEQPEHRNLNENKQPAHAWSKQPPFHYRNSKSAQRQDQPARGSSPGRPLPSALTSKRPFLIPLSWLCRRQGCQAAGAGLPFLAVFAPLSWTQSLGRKRVDHSVWPPGKGVGTLEVGWAHAKRIPPLQVALFWCHPPPAPQLRVSSCVLDHASRCDAPFWARSCPPMQCEGHILLSIGPCPNSPPKRGGSSHTALFAAMRPPQQYPRGGPNAHCT